MAHKEFMLKFKTGQEYLISVPKLRWRYQHLPMDNRPSKEVDATLTAAEFVRRRNSPDNGYYTFFYNGKEIHNFTINSYQDPNLVILDIDEPLPGHPVPKRELENKALPETDLIPDQPSEEAKLYRKNEMLTVLALRIVDDLIQRGLNDHDINRVIGIMQNLVKPSERLYKFEMNLVNHGRLTPKEHNDPVVTLSNNEEPIMVKVISDSPPITRLSSRNVKTPVSGD